MFSSQSCVFRKEYSLLCYEMVNYCGCLGSFLLFILVVVQVTGRLTD